MVDTVFTDVDLAAWRAALDRNQPSGDEPELADCVQVDAFRPFALNVGIAFRLAGRDGSVSEILLNPIAARHMAVCILKMGQEAGWLDEAANVICPPLGNA